MFLQITFWDRISTLPIYAQIIILALVSLGTILIFAKSIGFWGFLGTLKGKDKEVKSLVKHPLFVDYDYLKHKIQMVNIEDKQKQDMFKDLMMMKLEAINNHGHILREKADELCNENLYEIVIKSMSDIMNEYETGFRMKYGEEIFEFVFNHPTKGFNVVHERSILWIRGTLQSMTGNNVLVSNSSHEKVNFVLDMYRSAFLTMTYDMNIVYNSFNGELTKLLDKRVAK